MRALTLILTLALTCLLCPALVAADPDQTPPDPITNLQVTTGKTTMVVFWQNTGDDGTTGDAKSFEVRRSSTTITSRLSGQLVASGDAESSGSFTCRDFSSLGCNSPFYVAVFLKDDHNNWSALGTVAYAPTQSCTSIEEVVCYNLLRGSRGTGRPVTGDEDWPSA